MKRLIQILVLVTWMLPGGLLISAEKDSWPRTVLLEQGYITIYAPQVESFDEERLRFRAALAWFETPQADPVFGAGWFESDVVVDRFSRTVRPTDLEVKETRFPDDADIVEALLVEALEQPSTAWNLDFTLDEVQASLDAENAERQAAEKLNTKPPTIIYRDRPALLVTLDGDPVVRTIENSDLQAVINTPYPLLHDGRYYYLNVARDVWYRADSATGPYRFDTRVPAKVAAMVDSVDEEIPDVSEEPVTASNAPEIVVTTEPAELLVTDGPAAFVPLVDDLLVLQNSDDDVFMHLSEQEYYIVLAGRWYRSGSLNGPWAYQPADQLPLAFADIPIDSSQADARVYVAGTDEAQDAVRDAQVPQTAVVQRGEVDVDVDYDGEPLFVPVDGTDMSYASNSGSTVIQSDRQYFLVEDGVWYVSAAPNGPWQVATQRPAQVVTILPTSPVYNVKYVHVYHSTPDVVYVGYTPGYLGSYVYGNTVVYGSGWYYAPWVTPYTYYPRQSTWGFHVSYNPWYGWGFGLSWGWGPFGISYWSGGYWHHHHHWHHRHHGYWGPRGYRPRHGHRHGRHRYAHHGARPTPYGRHDNLYRDRGQRARVVDSRERRPTGRAGRYDDAKLVNANPVRGKRKGHLQSGKRYATVDARPVKRSELREKAVNQNKRAAVPQRNLLAANSGKSRSYERTTGRSKAGKTAGKPGTTPVAGRAGTKPQARKPATKPVARKPDNRPVKTGRSSDATVSKSRNYGATGRTRGAPQKSAVAAKKPAAASASVSTRNVTRKQAVPNARTKQKFTAAPRFAQAKPAQARAPQVKPAQARQPQARQPQARPAQARQQQAKQPPARSTKRSNVSGSKKTPRKQN